MIPEPGNSLAWDRYLYTRGNPLKYIDPSGHDVGCPGKDASMCKKPLLDGKGGPIPQIEIPPRINPIPLPEILIPTESYSTNGSNHEPFTENTDDFTGFWELDKLDALGIRFDFSIWIPIFPIFGGDINLDVVWSLPKNDVSVYTTLSGLAGLGEGAAFTIGLVGYYDTPTPESAEGLGFGGEGNFTYFGGGNISYGYSDKPGPTGRHSQTWSISGSGGLEASIAGSVGKSLLLKNWKLSE